MKNKDINLKQVMEKKQLTGIEVARVILEDWANLYEQIQNNIPPTNVLITPEIKQALIDKIKSDEEYESYLEIMKIKNWISDNCVVASVYKQQFYRVYAELHHQLVTFSICERIKNITEFYPRIESEKKYKLFLNKKIKEVIEKDEKLNYFLLLKEMLNWYNIAKKKNPRKKNPLNELKKVLSKEKVKGIEDISNKWDIISDPNGLHKFFTCFEYPVDITKEKEYLKDFGKFKKEYKVVYEMLIDSLSQYYPEITSLKDKEWLKSIGNYKDLQEKGFLDVQSLISSNNYLLYDNEFDQKNGVAIINKDICYNVKEDLKILEGLGNRFKKPEEKEDIKRSLYTLKYSLYFIKGFNVAMDILAEIYGLTVLKRFAFNLSGLKATLEKYNSLIDSALVTIEDSSFHNDKEIKERKDLIKEAFEKINFNSLKTPKENILKAKELAKDISFTKTPYFINLVASIDMKI